jgi:hypothetical protein
MKTAMRAMKMTNTIPQAAALSAPGRFRTVLACLTWLFLAGLATGQEPPSKSRVTEVPLQLLSAEITKFNEPVHIGSQGRAIEYREVLVLKVAVDRDRFDSLPPDIEPYLYIGRSEYRAFHIDRAGQGKDLILTFHIREWDALEDGAPVVLTIDHGGPVRHSEMFSRREGPRFHKKMIIDKR